MQFDDLPTNSSGVGFYPTDPKQPALRYKGVYLQSFMLLNASSADLTNLDKTCSSSWPNSIFASRKEGYAWPRISLHDLSKPPSELAEDVLKSNRTFSIASLHIKATGNVTGTREDTIGVIDFTMMKLVPDPRDGPIPPEAGFPGIVQGEPLPVSIANVTSWGLVFPPGAIEGISLNIKEIFGDEFGKGVDVIEVTSQIYRKDKKSPNFYPSEDWEFCLDDIVLDIAEGDSHKPFVPGGEFFGVKADGSRVSKDDREWEILGQRSLGADTFSFSFYEFLYVRMIVVKLYINTCSPHPSSDLR